MSEYPCVLVFCISQPMQLLGGLASSGNRDKTGSKTQSEPAEFQERNSLDGSDLACPPAYASNKFTFQIELG